MSLKGEFGAIERAFEKRIDCPLRDQLAAYFAGTLKMPPDKSMLRANEFMRRYLASADRTLLERVATKGRGDGRRRWA